MIQALCMDVRFPEWGGELLMQLEPQRVLVERVLAVICVLFVAVLGIIHLPHPFTGDTAMFMAGARVLDDGGIYYLDYWDVKQPGIYLFFWLAGKLFGFDEIGAHSLDLVWMLLLSALLIGVIRGALENRWLSVLVPVVTVGLYYINAESWHLTQVEILVSLPLLVTLWLVTKPYHSPRSRWIGHFLAGCSIVVVAMFKMLYLPLALSFLILPLIRRFRECGFVAALTQDVIPAALGITTLFLGLLSYLLYHGALYEFYWATFVYPLEVAAEIDQSNGRQLIGSVLWLGKITAPLVPLLVVAIIAIPERLSNTTYIQFALWLFLALFLLLIQKYSWWEYQFQLLYVPVGVLTIFGLDIITTRLNRSQLPVRARHIYIVAGLAVFYMVAGGLGYFWMEKAQRLAVSVYQGRGWGDEYRKAIDARYRAYWNSTRFLHDSAAVRGDIYIFGDPMMLMLSGRKQAAIPVNGWGLWATVESQWSVLPAKFNEVYVPYIFLAAEDLDLIQASSPGMMEVLKKRYKRLRMVEPVPDAGPWVAGTWYEILDSNPRGAILHDKG